MADVSAAIDYVLGWEDATLSGVITTNPNGLKTRFGIDQTYHPELTNCLFFGSMGSVAALQIAKSIYDLSYAQPLSIAEIANQKIANKLLSLGVNVGVARASKWLQDAVGAAEDGVIGVNTLMKLSDSNPDQVLTDLRNSAERYYRELAASNPEDAQFLDGWVARARA